MRRHCLQISNFYQDWTSPTRKRRNPASVLTGLRERRTHGSSGTDRCPSGAMGARNPRARASGAEACVPAARAGAAWCRLATRDNIVLGVALSGRRVQFARSEEPRLRRIARQVKAGGRLQGYPRGLERPRAEVSQKLGTKKVSRWWGHVGQLREHSQC